MPQLVRIREDLPPIRVPDGATQDQIVAAVQRSGLLSGPVAQSNVDRPLGEAPRGEFFRGVSAGVDSLQGSLYGLAALVGDSVGEDKLTQWGLENYQRNAQEAAAVGPRVGTLHDINDVGDFMQYASGALGQAVPSLATMAGTGGVGGAVGSVVAKRAATRLVEKGVEKKAAALAVERALASPAARAKIMSAIKVGAGTGAFVGSAGQQQGDLYGTLREAGIEDAALPAWGFGAAMGALDVVPEAIIAKKLTKDVVEHELGKSLMRGIAKGTAQQAAIEGSTEGAQQALGTLARITSGGADWNDKDTQDVLNNMAAGAIVGSVMGAPTEIATKFKARKSNVKPEGGDQAPGESQARPTDTARRAPVRGADPASAPVSAQAATGQKTGQAGKEQIPAEPVAPSAPTTDAPTAEPALDLEAQVRDLIDTKNPRKGVYLSQANIQQYGFDPAHTPSGLALIQNADGQGGVMLAKPADANAFQARLRKGEAREQLIGEFTLAGQGKPVTDNPAVVQQKNADGAVTAESVVDGNDPTQIENVRTQFGYGGRATEVTSPEAALQRREQLIANPEAAAAAAQLQAAMAKFNARKTTETAQGELQFDLSSDLAEGETTADSEDATDVDQLGKTDASTPYTYIGVGNRTHGEQRVLSQREKIEGRSPTYKAMPYRGLDAREKTEALAKQRQMQDPDATYIARQLNEQDATAAGLQGPGWYVAVYQQPSSEMGFASVAGGRRTQRQLTQLFIARAKERWDRLSLRQKNPQSGDMHFGFKAHVLDAAGKPVLDNNGKPRTINLTASEIVSLGQATDDTLRGSDAMSIRDAFREGLRNLLLYTDDEGHRYQPEGFDSKRPTFNRNLVLRDGYKRSDGTAVAHLTLGDAHAYAKEQSRATGREVTPFPGESEAEARQREVYRGVLEPKQSDRDESSPSISVTTAQVGGEVRATFAGRSLNAAKNSVPGESADARAAARAVDLRRSRMTAAQPEVMAAPELIIDRAVVPPTDAGLVGEPIDTRGFESEAAQNERSINQRTGRARDTYNAQAQSSPIADTEVNEAPPVMVSMKNPRLSKAIDGAVTNLRRILKLNFNLVVTDQIDNLTAAMRATGESALADKAHTRSLDMGNRWGFVGGDTGTKFIYINPANSHDLKRVMRTLGHELGHVFFKTHWIKTDLGTRNEIYKAFDAFLEKNPDFRTDAGNYGKRLEEWMADQVAAWIATDRTPRTAVEQWFADLAKALKDAWAYINQTYTLDQTVKQYIADTLTAGESEVAPELQSLGAANDPFQYDMDHEPSQPTSRMREVWTKARAIKAKHPKINGLLDFTGDAIMAMHNGLTASLQARIHRMNIPAFNKIVKEFHHRAGETGGFTYNAAVKNRMRNFIADYDKIVSNMNDDTKTVFLEQLRQEKAIDQMPVALRKAATQFRALMQRLYAYQREAHMPIKEVQEYFPQIADVEQMLKPEAVDEIYAAIEQSGVKWNTSRGEIAITKEMVREWVNNYTDDAYAVDFDPARLEDTEGNMRSPFQQALKTRVLPKEVRAVIAGIKDEQGRSKYYNKDLDGTIQRYVREAVRRSEYNRRFGDVTWDEDANLSQEEPRQFNAYLQFHDLMKQARAEGATPDQQELMFDAMSAFMGQYKRIKSEPLRKLTRSVAFYQNLRTLLLVTLSSLPEVATLFLRTGDFGRTWSVMRQSARDAFQKGGDTAKLLRAYGFAVDELDALAFDEFKQARDFDSKLDRANESWFRMVGLTRWTNFMRGLSLNVSLDYVKEHARRVAAGADTNGDSQRRLDELGISVDDVRTWAAAGEPVYGERGVSPEDIRLKLSDYTPEQVAATEKVTGAITRMISEMVVDPTAAMKPLWRSDERLSLVSQLGSFTYGFTNQVLSRVWHELTRDGATTMQRAQVAASIALMLPLIALGLELKELVQYSLFGKKAPTDDMRAPQYLSQLVQRSGLLGVAQLGIDAANTAGANKSPFLAFTGPTISQINDAFTQPAYKVIPGAIPVIGQIPGLRDPLRATLK